MSRPFVRKQKILTSKKFEQNKRRRFAWKTIGWLSSISFGIIALIQFINIPHVQIRDVVVDDREYKNMYADALREEIHSKVLATIEYHLDQPVLWLLNGRNRVFNPAFRVQSYLLNVDSRILAYDIHYEGMTLVVTPQLRTGFALWCHTKNIWCAVVDAGSVVIGDQKQVYGTDKPMRIYQIDDIDSQQAFAVTDVPLLMMKTLYPAVFESSKETEQVPKAGEQYMESFAFVDLLALQKALDKQGVQVVDIFLEHSTTEDITSAVLTHASGQEIRVLIGTSESYADVVKYFSLFLAQIKKDGILFEDFEYVDLRFGNSVYFKRKTQQTEGTVMGNE